MNINITEYTLQKFVDEMGRENKYIERVLNTENGIIVRLENNETS